MMIKGKFEYLPTYLTCKGGKNACTLRMFEKNFFLIFLREANN